MGFSPSGSRKKRNAFIAALTHVLQSLLILDIHHPQIRKVGQAVLKGFIPVDGSVFINLHCDSVEGHSAILLEGHRQDASFQGCQEGHFRVFHQIAVLLVIDG